MKVFFILIFSSAFILSSCTKKCNCEGTAPVISPQGEALVIFKADTVVDFINQDNLRDTIKVITERTKYEDKLRTHVGNFLFGKTCYCASDFVETDGYTQTSTNNTFYFSLTVLTDKKGNEVSYRYNTTGFTQFDSTAISRVINNKLVTGLSVKRFSSMYDSVSNIYYKENLGLVSVVYRNGKIVDLK